MDDLLKFAIEAHGGLERWHQFNVVKANASITGALWQLKGQPDLLKNLQVVAGPNGAAASSEVRGRLDSKIRQLNIKKYSSGKFNSQNAGNCQDSVISISASTFVFSEIQTRHSLALLVVEALG